MKPLLLLVVSSYVFAMAPTNSVWYADQTGSTQTSRPFSTARYFAKGEIKDYPKPLVDGTPPSPWQADVKTRHRDGKVSRTITAASNATPIVITSTAHGFLDGELVTITGVGGNTAANGTWRILRRGRDAFALVGPEGNGTYTSGGTAVGPTEGSVAFSIVSYAATLVGAKTVTSVSTSTGDLTVSSHGYSAGQVMRLVSSDKEPTGFIPSVAYYVCVQDTNTIRLRIVSSTCSSPVVPTTTGTGTIRVAIPVEVRFVNSTDQCSSGNSAACDSAALNEAGILAFNSGAWGAAIEATPPGLSALTFNARTMVDDANFRYWLRGPAVTQVIAEDRSVNRVYDAGSTCASNCTTDYSTATWTNDTTNKSLHPAFILTFPTGWAGVKVDYILENMWGTRLQDQRYSLNLFSAVGLGTTEYTKAAFPHYLRTRWRKTFWDGTEPGAILEDHNFKYMQYSKIIPQYSASLVVDDNEIDSEGDVAVAQNVDINGNGYFAKAFGTTGGRPEIGYLTRWEVRWLYSMHPRLRTAVLDNGNISGHIPMHFRESYDGATVRYFIDIDLDGDTYNDAADSAGGDVHGRIVSYDSRPSFRSNSLGAAETTAEDRFTVVATASGSHGWTLDLAHQSNFGYLSYITTGDYYFLEEVLFWAIYCLGASNPGEGQIGRKYAWAILNQDNQTRGVAWGLRNIMHAAILVPPSDVEGEMIRDKLKNKIQSLEGEHFLKYPEALLAEPIQEAPYSDPCPTAGGTNPNTGRTYSTYLSSSFLRTRNTPYCYGHRSVRKTTIHLANPLGFYNSNTGTCSSSAWTSCGNSSNIDQPFMYHFHAIVFGRMRELGFPVDGLHNLFSRSQLGTLHPTYNRYLCCTYLQNTWRKSDNNYFQSYSDLLASNTPAGQAKSTWNESCGGDATDCGTDPSDGYIHYYLAAISFMTDLAYGPAIGSDVYSWFTNNANVPYQAKTFGGLVDTKWAIVERRSPAKTIRVRPGSTQLLLDYTAPTTAACTITVDDSSDYASPVYGPTGDGGGGRQRVVVVGGLSSSTPYYYKILCGDNYYGALEGVTATVAVGGASSIALRLTGPSGSADAIVDYGPTASYGSSTAPAACAPSCTVSVPGTTGQVLYYRHVFRNGSASVIATGLGSITVP